MDLVHTKRLKNHHCALSTWSLVQAGYPQLFWSHQHHPDPHHLSLSPSYASWSLGIIFCYVKYHDSSIKQQILSLLQPCYMTCHSKLSLSNITHPSRPSPISALVLLTPPNYVSHYLLCSFSLPSLSDSFLFKNCDASYMYKCTHFWPLYSICLIANCW